MGVAFKGVVLVPAKKLTVPVRVPVRGLDATVAVIVSELPMATVVDGLNVTEVAVVIASTLMAAVPADGKKLLSVPGE